MIEDIKQEMEDNANYYDEDDEGNVDLPKIMAILDKYKINQKDNSLTIWEHYKDYYKDTNKEDILWDTYLDYCAWINNIKYSKEIQSQLDKYKNAWNDLKDLHLKTKGTLAKEEINSNDIIVYNQMVELEQKHNISKEME